MTERYLYVTRPKDLYRLYRCKQEADLDLNLLCYFCAPFWEQMTGLKLPTGSMDGVRVGMTFAFARKAGSQRKRS
jgi:hypothetical protein